MIYVFYISIKNYNNVLPIPEIILNENLSIKSIKRFFGKTKDELLNSNLIPNYLKKVLVDDNGVLKLKINDKLITPIEIASFIFAKLFTIFYTF